MLEKDALERLQDQGNISVSNLDPDENNTW